jgi:hypothetical protein
MQQIQVNLKELYLIAEEGSYVSYLEGCTAPMRDENQLHAAVVELVALDNVPKLNILPFKIGTLAIKKEKVEFIIL